MISDTKYVLIAYDNNPSVKAIYLLILVTFPNPEMSDFTTTGFP